MLIFREVHVGMNIDKLLAVAVSVLLGMALRGISRQLRVDFHYFYQGSFSLKSKTIDKYTAEYNAQREKRETQ